MYVLVRDDGMYVADIYLTGGSSYTRDLRKAKRFTSKAAAEQDRCPGNESVRNVHDELEGRIHGT